MLFDILCFRFHTPGYTIGSATNTWIRTMKRPHIGTDAIICYFFIAFDKNTTKRIYLVNIIAFHGPRIIQEVFTIQICNVIWFNDNVLYANITILSVLLSFSYILRIESPTMSA